MGDGKVPWIYLPRKIKVEPDLSFVQDKFSVRYECQQILKVDENYKVYSGFIAESAWFFRVLYFYKFSSMLSGLSSENFNKLRW